MKNILNFFWLAIWGLGAIGVMLYFFIMGPWPIAFVQVGVAAMGFSKAKEIYKSLSKEKGNGKQAK